MLMFLFLVPLLCSGQNEVRDEKGRITSERSAIERILADYKIKEKDLKVIGCFKMAGVEGFTTGAADVWEVSYMHKGKPWGLFFVHSETGECLAFFAKGKLPSKTLKMRLMDFMRVFAEPLGILGLIGQLMFTARFFIQWLVSEKNKKSTVPEIFWYFSLIGGFLVLIYAIWRKDPVITLGQATGLFVYVRNIMLIHKARKGEKIDATSEAEGV